jgi:hypothetical protein
MFDFQWSVGVDPSVVMPNDRLSNSDLMMSHNASASNDSILFSVCKTAR